jgi:hypothetical protein
MTDYLLPTNIYPSSQQWRIVDNVGVFQSPFTGGIRTVARTGARMGCTLTYPPMKGQDRARMEAFVASLRGKGNRAYVLDFAHTQRGSFPATELLTNNDFSNGTTGYSGTNVSQAVSDCVLRSTRLASGVTNVVHNSSAATAVQYAPYAARVMMQRSVAATQLGIGIGSSATGVEYGFTSGSIGGLITKAVVPFGTSLYTTAFDEQASGIGSREFYDTSYISLARCALIDNGPNALIQSDTFQTTWTTVNASVSANAAAAPDGTTTMDALVDTVGNVNHALTQAFTVTSAAQDVEFGVSVLGGARGFCAVELAAAGGSAIVYVNLTTGAVSTAAAVSGNFTNPRAFVVSQGNSRFRIWIVARKGGSETSVSATVYACNVTGATAYIGAGTNAIYVWRGSASVNSVPSRSAQTTTTALASGTSQTGSGIYVKGLPASTSGLLKVGDVIQCGDQINIVTAPLDSDAAGLGYLQCGNPWRVAVADNTPIHVKTPMAKMILVSDTLDWDTGPGQFSGFQLEFIEDVA